MLNRRSLVSGLTSAGLLCLSDPLAAVARPRGKSFSFVHITDTHIQPELGATEGVKKAFDAIRHLPEKPAFALIGGDLVMDANEVDRARAELTYDLWQQAASDLRLPLHYSIGNHDLFGIGGKSGVTPDDPEYGKKWWQKRLGLANRYDTFEFNGWRFITLDSIQTDPDGKWRGEFDTEQLTWLDNTLRKTDPKQPVVLLTHVPILTVFRQYTEGTTAATPDYLITTNGKAVQEMLQGRNVKAVFQGHTHVVEEVSYLGTRYITGGAVCGDWWKGPRLGVHPEGFTVVTVRDGDLSYRYVSYGWTARKA